MTATVEAPRPPALIAKAALRYLAERRLQPTPQNYAEAWRAVGGASAGATLDAHAGDGGDLADGLIRLLLDARLIEREQAGSALAFAREHRWKDAVDRLAEPLLRTRDLRWAPLLGELLAQIDVAHRGWPATRKRDSLRRVLELPGARDDLLAARLRALIETWAHEPVETSAADGPVTNGEAQAGARADGGAAGADGSTACADASCAERSASPADCIGSVGGTVGSAAPASPVVAATSADESAVAQRQRAERLIAEMSELLRTLCESLVNASEESGWLRDQAQTLREALRGTPDHRQLAQVRLLLAQTQDSQRHLGGRRREALRELKQMLAQWVGSVAELSDSADRFGEQIGGYADEIARADSLESLADTVQSLIGETRDLRSTIERSRDEFDGARTRALALESEVSRLEEQLAAASAQMITDHLTNTMNRRGLEEAFVGAQRRSDESGGALALVLLDVDDFKKLNDALGHHGGDGALRHLARLLKEKSRPVDAVARYGGEEFVLLLPELEAFQAAEHMARLQREVTSHVFLHEARQTFITFSAGVTRVRTEDSLATAVSRADEAMYAAKRAGKNCVRTAG